MLSHFVGEVHEALTVVLEDAGQVLEAVHLIEEPLADRTNEWAEGIASRTAERAEVDGADLVRSGRRIGEVDADRCFEQSLFGLEVLVQGATARLEPSRFFDLTDRRGIEPLRGEQSHPLVEQSLARRDLFDHTAMVIKRLPHDRGEQMATLRYVDPLARRSRLTPLMARLGTNRVANVISRRIGWRLDPILLRLTGGRLAMTLVIPTAVLETEGARSGQRRRNAVIYFHDQPDRAIIAASNAGRPRHPDWYYNLRANPKVTLGGLPARAAIVDDPADQERLWALADRVFPAFATYRRSTAVTNLTIPLISLDLADPTT